MRYKGRWIASGILLAVLLAANGAARMAGGFAEWYAAAIYPEIAGAVAWVSNLFPFSLIEFLLYAAAACILFFVIRAIWRLVKKKRTLLGTLYGGVTWVIVTVLALFTVETFTCGINYYRDEFSKVSGLTIEESTEEDLTGLCRSLAEEIGQAAESLSWDAQGEVILDENAREEAREAMASLGGEYPALTGYYPRPKPVLTSAALSYQQLAGIYSAFTIEANYNNDMPEYQKPSTMCHELSHLRGFMREDEANYIAYLACKNSGIPSFQYSGAMLAFVHATNALYGEDAEVYWEIRESLPEQVKQEWGAGGEWWAQYEGPVAEAYDRGADAFLKANGQADGTKSYGRMVDLLLADYRKQKEDME